MAACHSEPADRAPPSGSMSGAEANFGMGASKARLRHSSAQPTGTQSLCRFLGSFTVCQITAGLVLCVASPEHLLLTPPCQGHFWIHVSVHAAATLAVNNARTLKHNKDANQTQHVQVQSTQTQGNERFSRFSHAIKQIPGGVTDHTSQFTNWDKQCNLGDHRDLNISI